MGDEFDVPNPTKEDLKRIYNDRKKYSRTFNQLENYADFMDKYRMHAILKVIEHNQISSILDNGCGSAVISRELAKSGYEVTGFDISEVLLAQIPKIKNLKLMVGDCDELPFKDSSFDCIICSEVLEHIKDNQLTIVEITRVIKKDGVVIITVPNLAGYDSLDGKFKIITAPIRFVNFFLRLLHLPEVYKYGYSTHFHKLFPWEWKKLLEANGLEVLQDQSVFISFWFPDILRFIERFFYNLPGIFTIKIWIDDWLCMLFPFKYFGQTHLFIYKKKTGT